MALSIAVDGSKQKRERRLTTFKLIKRAKPAKVLATNFPEAEGRKFVAKKLVGLLRADITLVERTGFSKASKDLDGLVTKKGNTDIFYEMLSNQYDFLDLDLCTGLHEEGKNAIEQCSSWKTIIITITDRFRDRWGRKAARPNGTHLQTFMFDWCKSKGWNCQLTFSPGPYRRRVLDGRAPIYYTFIITRP